jgi:hypothetical protein
MSFLSFSLSVKPFLSSAMALFPTRSAHVFQPHKTSLTESALDDIFSFIWACDPHNYEHPRYRVQTALTSLLIYHLGMHPTVALGEGLYYRDTTLLITKQGDALRVLLLICLRGRKNLYNSEQR